MSAFHLDIHRAPSGAIAELRIDNPSKLNALTPEMLLALEAHCDAIEADDAVRAVVLSAEGDRAFCAGADIRAWADLSPAAFGRLWVRRGHRALDRLARLARPTVAAVSGPAFGGGLELAAACDMRMIAPGARIGLPEAKVGVVPGWSGTQRMVRLIGEPAVKEMALFGRMLSAERAHDLGFAADIADDARKAAFAAAEGAAQLSPRSVEITKNMIHAGVGEDAPALVEALGSVAISASDDRLEGVAAFREKRAAHFTGV